MKRLALATLLTAAAISLALACQATIPCRQHSTYATFIRHEMTPTGCVCVYSHRWRGQDHLIEVDGCD